MLRYGELIKDVGQITEKTGSWEKYTLINYSDIFTELIQAAGNLCERYASDLFYDLKAIEESVIKLENAVYYIGFRELGVDGNSFVKCRLESDKYSLEYRRLYRLEMYVEKDRGYDQYVMKLSRISPSDAYRKIKEGK